MIGKMGGSRFPPVNRRPPQGPAVKAHGRMHDHHLMTGRLVRRLGGWFVVCLILVGCRPNKRSDLIEAELRTRERELAETRAALERERSRNNLPGPNLGPPAWELPPPGASAGGPQIREITLGRGTGGVDDDDLPGDESLMVVIVPTDEDKSAVKVTARVTIAAWEITRQGLKNPIGNWEIPADKLRMTWRTGLLATGYFVPLQWQTFPSTERVRVAVRLTTTDGREFEADRDITVRPVTRWSPRTPPVPAGPSAPMVPPVPPAVAPTPVQPNAPGGREPLLPGSAPPGIPPGVEELPPPAGLPPGRGVRLLPPVAR